MPFGTEGVAPGIGLALSGGGFRAALFHCGVLWRLNELAYLPKLTRISSVSGGSIVAGRLAVRWPALQFTGGVATNLIDLVVRPLRSFCRRSVDTTAAVAGAVVPGKQASDMLRRAYQAHLVGPAKLGDLPDVPSFIFSATNLSSGVDFRFSKPYAGDRHVGLIRNPDFPLALAVAASSALPPFLSPLEMKVDPNRFERVPGAIPDDTPTARSHLMLTDGGLYDNLGIETIWRRLDTILVSDGGAPFSYTTPARDWFRQALRALDVTTNQARGLRKRRLIELYRREERKGAYWGIMTEIGGYAVLNALTVPVETTAKLARMRARLNSFSEGEQCSLINWGYAVCDAAMRRFVAVNAAPPAGWPYPDYALDRPLAKDVRVEDTIPLVDVRSAP
jgi:NTE family protein